MQISPRLSAGPGRHYSGLLLSRPTQDFFALLFIPISLSVVLFYGKRGFLWIAAFTLACRPPDHLNSAGILVL